MHPVVAWGCNPPSGHPTPAPRCARPRGQQSESRCLPWRLLPMPVGTRGRRSGASRLLTQHGNSLRRHAPPWHRQLSTPPQLPWRGAAPPQAPNLGAGRSLRSPVPSPVVAAADPQATDAFGRLGTWDRVRVGCRPRLPWWGAARARAASWPQRPAAVGYPQPSPKAGDHQGPCPPRRPPGHSNTRLPLARDAAPWTLHAASYS